jgi:hypothetical protein
VTQLLNGDVKALGEYVRDLADRMGLRDWVINIMKDPPENVNHGACIDVIYGRRVANLQFREEWPEWDSEQLRSTVCHELVHCHINPLRNAIDNIEAAVGKMIYDPLYNSVTDYIEYATDAIATAWAETLPLPEVQRATRKKAA